MSKPMETALIKAATLTFEELGFMFATADLTEDQKEMPLDISVAVDFDGPTEGKLMIHISNDLLPVIAANMLGEIEPPDERMQQDALGEIANVICGNVLPVITGSKDVFNLGSPQVWQNGDNNSVEFDMVLAAEAQIGLEQGRAHLQLFLVKIDNNRRNS